MMRVLMYWRWLLPIAVGAVIGWLWAAAVNDAEQKPRPRPPSETRSGPLA